MLNSWVVSDDVDVSDIADNGMLVISALLKKYVVSLM